MFIHALINWLTSAQLWRRGELWLRANVNKSIKISDKENILGYIDNEIDNLIINMCILNTKIIIYKMRQDCDQMKLIEVLRLLYKEMKDDDYGREVNPKLMCVMKNVGSYYIPYLRNRRNKSISLSPTNAYRMNKTYKSVSFTMITYLGVGYRVCFTRRVYFSCVMY